jgi:hypothetical protein
MCLDCQGATHFRRVLEYANKPKVAEKVERERAENERKAHHQHHKKQRDFVCVSLFISFPDFCHH